MGGAVGFVVFVVRSTPGLPPACERGGPSQLKRVSCVEERAHSPRPTPAEPLGEGAHVPEPRALPGPGRCLPASWPGWDRRRGTGSQRAKRFSALRSVVTVLRVKRLLGLRRKAPPAPSAPPLGTGIATARFAGEETRGTAPAWSVSPRDSRSCHQPLDLPSWPRPRGARAESHKQPGAENKVTHREQEPRVPSRTSRRRWQSHHQSLQTLACSTPAAI